MAGNFALLLLALFSWLIGAVWLIGGLKFAAFLSSSGRGVETGYLIQIVALRTFGMFLAGVQFILFYGSLTQVTFWPLTIGVLLLISSRVYMLVLKRKHNLPFLN